MTTQDNGMVGSWKGTSESGTYSVLYRAIACLVIIGPLVVPASASALNGGPPLARYVLTRLAPLEEPIPGLLGLEPLHENGQSLLDQLSVRQSATLLWFEPLALPPAACCLSFDPIEHPDTMVVPLPSSAGLSLAALLPFCSRRRRQFAI